MIDSFLNTRKTSGRGANTGIDKRVRRHVTGRVREYFAVTSPGFEKGCRHEIMGLGVDAHGATMETGGVTFAGRFVDCQRANLHLRTATRILMRVATFAATNPRQLARQTAAIPWELFLPADQVPAVKVSCQRSRLYHSAVVAETVRAAIGRQLGGSAGSSPSQRIQTVFVRIQDDRVTLSVDSSGEPLYKRGFKTGPARAPIRESLAAAILMAAGYDRRRPLVDPLCGSGTFSLEAALMAKQRAPGVKRDFAFMAWPAFRKEQWDHLKKEATSSEVTLESPRIFASDVDEQACRRLAAVIDINGLSDAVRVANKDLFACEASQYGGDPGLVAVNPPYGVRIGSSAAAEGLFGRICRHLKAAFNGWDVALIAPHHDLVRHLPFPARQLPLAHGGLKLTLLLGTLG
jgi:putative N6-adenine-specific DNA methylase